MTRSNRVLNGFAKAGFHSGNLHAKNILAGRVDVTLTTGDGTTTVTFAKPMRNADYLVLTCPQETTTNNDLCISVSDKSEVDFVINVTSTNHTTPITVGFLVLDTRGASSVSQFSGRFGIHSGYAHFRNLQWGMCRMTIDGSGDGTAKIITLKRPMKNKPLIFASWDDDTAVTAGFIAISTAQTNSTFSLDCYGCTGPTTNADITWVAFDPGFNFGTTDADGHSGTPYCGNRQGKFGIHSGDFRAKNFIGGLHALTTDGSGDITEAVTFGQMLRQTPTIFVFKQSPVADTTAVCFANGGTISGFTIGVNNSATTTAAVYLAYLAIDPEWLATKYPESELIA